MHNLEFYPTELEGEALVKEIREKEPEVPILSVSQLNTWNRCEMQWYLSYQEGWTEREEKSYLTLGKLGHEDLRVWYATRSRESVLAKMAEHYTQYAFQDDHLPLLAIETWLVNRYLESFAPAEDRNFVVEAVEEHFTVALWTPQGRKFYLQGYTDVRGIDKSSGGRWLWDHKFSTKFMSPMEVKMDPQLPTYVAAWRIHGFDVFGTLYNQLNTYDYKDRSKLVNEKLFRRELNFVSPKQADKILQEVGLAVDDMIDSKTKVVRRRLSRDCARCWFVDPCSFGLNGMDMNSILPVRFKKKTLFQPEGEVVSNGAALNIHL